MAARSLLWIHPMQRKWLKQFCSMYLPKHSEPPSLESSVKYWYFGDPRSLLKVPNSLIQDKDSCHAGSSCQSILLQAKVTARPLFLAALSSSRSLVVGWSVGPSVRRSVRHVCEKVTFVTFRVSIEWVSEWVIERVTKKNCD